MFVLVCTQGQEGAYGYPGLSGGTGAQVWLQFEQAPLLYNRLLKDWMAEKCEK